MKVPEGQERLATIEEAFHKSRTSSLKALSTEVGISYVTDYRIITQIR